MASIISEGRGLYADEETVFRQNDFEIDWRTKEVKVDGQPIHLSPLEYELLATLVRKRGWLVPHDALLREVWGDAHVGERANLKLYIWYIRRKIERDPSNPTRILTRTGMGYMFAVPSADRPPRPANEGHSKRSRAARSLRK